MISVMMPVYNAEPYLREAIDSILNQTNGDFEFIIVNDGSTDRSEEVILSYSDPRIKYIHQANGGVASARNAALQQVQGEFVVFQDADDVSLPNRLERLRKNFYSDQIGIVHSDMLLIDQKGKPISYWHSSNIERDRLLRFFLKVGTPFMIPSSMVRRDLLANFHYLPYKIGEDSDMIFKTALAWESVHISEPLLLYRRHDTNSTSSSDYNTLFSHVKAFLRRHSLSELIPELPWQTGDNNNQAMASAIVAMFLFRRGLSVDAKEWYDKAQQGVASSAADKFVQAIGRYTSGEYDEALRLLLSIDGWRDNAVILNYAGEIAACLKQVKEAMDYFSGALQIKPDYQEPLENMKSLGGSIHLHLVDVAFNKFSKTHYR